MHDALAVRNLERIADLDAYVDDLVGCERVPSDLLVQTLAFQQFHGDEVLAVAFLDGIDRADVGVIQGRGGACLLLEALQGERVRSKSRERNFRADMASESGVLSFIHNTHTPATQFSQDGVVKKALPKQGFQSTKLPSI